MKRDIESWIDEIELSSGCIGDDKHCITHDCVKMIQLLLTEHTNNNVTGKYFYHRGIEKKFPSQAITYKLRDLGITSVHDGVWEFNGEYCEDYYVWVGYILVYFHHADGSGSDWLVGHNTKGVFASNQLMYDRFYKQFKPEYWDFEEI